MTSSPFILGNDDPQAAQVREDGDLALATRRGDRYESEGKANQDRVATVVVEGVHLDLVCDGLGGYAEGDQAAQLLAEALQPDVNALLRDALKAYRQAALPEDSGSTLLYARTEQDQLEVAHIGDSRALLFDVDGGLVWQSRDHKPEDFWARFKLSRYVHQMEEAELLDQLSIKQFDLHSFDQDLLLVLCSDGVTDNLKTSLEDKDCVPQIAQVIRASADPETICNQLMARANIRMDLAGTAQGEALDVKPDNSACLVRRIRRAPR